MRSTDPISRRYPRILFVNLLGIRRALSKNTSSATVRRFPIPKRLKPRSSCRTIAQQPVRSSRESAQQPPRPEPSFLDDNVTSKQPLAKPLHGSVQTGPFEEMPFRSNTHQYDPRHYHVQAKD